MVAPIAFFERLAPGVVEHLAVRPALPSRFAPARPEASLGEPVADHAAVSLDQSRARPQRRIEHEIPLRAPQENDRAQPPLPASSDAVATVSSSWPGFAVNQPTPAAPRAVPAPSPRPVVSPSAIRDRPAPPPGRVPERGSRMGVVPDASAISSAATALPLIDARPPLREPVVRQRAAPEARFAPTEVYVTIDRIDVRAPASVTGGAPPPAAKRRAAPSLSLADYLLQREQARKSGGAR